MPNVFRIVVAPVKTAKTDEWCWQAVCREQTLASGFEANVLEALESAACSLGFWLDTHPEFTPAAIHVDVEYTDDCGWKERFAIGGKQP